jgi:Nif-specific regulatory protein
MTTPSDPQSLVRERDSLKKILTGINAKYLEKIEELSLVRRVGDALKDITDFATVCKSIVAIIQQELDPDNCSLMMVEEESRELVLRAAKGPYDDEAVFIRDPSRTTRFAIGTSIAGHVARTGASALVQDVRNDDLFLHTPDTRVEIRSLLSLPLVSGDRVIAVLNLSHTEPNTFTPDRERLLAIIANSSAAALENTRLYEKLRESRDRLARENIDLKKELHQTFSPGNIIGASSRFAEVLTTVEKIAGVDVNVLITGESGTGKELIAKTLHYNSPRAAGPLVSVNCAALPEALLESELFGIEKGVATGVERRPGKFELADGGTIFLDEIGDMAPATQARILRVLQEREVQRVGGSKTIQLDVRVLSATNKDLAAEIKTGGFREDLFYRLKVVEVHLPPLRERVEDIVLLANFFLKQACKQHGLGEKWFSQKALDQLRRNSWHGNVRELQNVVSRAAILSAGEVIGPHDLGFAPESGEAGVQVSIPGAGLNFHATLKAVTEEAERMLIVKALEQTGNNKARAAQLLGIGRRTLMYKLSRMEK